MYMMSPENTSLNTQEEIVNQPTKHLDGEPMSVAEIIANGDPVELKKLDDRYMVGSALEEKASTQEQQEAFDSGKEMVLKLQQEGNIESPEYWSLYSYLTVGLGKDIDWRSADEIDVEKVKKLLAVKFPEKDQIQIRVCSNCGREYIGSKVSFCTACGGDLELKQTNLDSGMEDRVVKKSELLNEKQASKEFFVEDRNKLAEEIRAERKLQRSRLSVMKIYMENAQAQESIEDENAQYSKLSEMQSAEASSIANRLSSFELNTEDAIEERENISQLIDSSEGVESIKKKLKDHYEKADGLAKEKFESVQKSVEQTMLRNDAFIVHTFLLDEKLRHNDNSNISKKATLSDDIDMLLSLEPSISSSSVVPGVKQGLWGERIGVVLGGGDIMGVAQTDDGTLTGGIKYRNGTISSSQEIDEKVSDKSERGYNEIVVNNPKVFGLFQNVKIDESGKMIGFSPGRSESENEKRKDDFMEYVNLATEKGMPALIMTPDRRLFEFVSIDDKGVVSLGLEITPKQIALGNAGLSNENRKDVGERVLSKNLLKHIKDQQEAKEILAEISGNGKERIELSTEEYLSYLKNNQEGFHELPKHLLEDRDFMLEASKLNPVSAYNNASEALKRDENFIKHVFSLDKTVNTSSVYSIMPDDMKKNESIALLAIENGDIDYLDSSFVDNSIVFEKIIDKIVEEKNPSKWFSRAVGEVQVPNFDFYMKNGVSNVNMTDRIISDGGLIQKLNTKYPNYKFEVDEYKQVVVTKLSE